MASLEFSNSVLKSKFRGCMIGALVGDCLGIPFEFKDYEWKADSFKIVLPSKQKLGEFITNVTSEGIFLLITVPIELFIFIYSYYLFLNIYYLLIFCNFSNYIFRVNRRDKRVTSYR